MTCAEDQTSKGSTFPMDSELSEPSESEMSAFFSSSFDDKTLSDLSSATSEESEVQVKSASSVFNESFIESSDLFDSSIYSAEFVPSDYGGRPEVTLPILDEDAANYYIGVMTDTEAFRFLTRRRSFFLYHSWDPESDQDQLPLMFIYRALNGECYNINVKLNDLCEYYVEQKMFLSLTDLVNYYAEEAQFESDQDLFDLD
ncbi:unnamed protein product [Bursaphelenchus xylophilus]|uniref:(pine wood nematode) hypothetical protein n=1 Tax=Bursaphelenchus xylophilus TaxID=6326 RepID=A0A1I7SW68_BURXY|nr:unnamed protein product [Bursaphelenchus xylophilus]CAG9098912.1 unnamed protein product [Bursaphelenchus xylophilus]